MKKKPNKFGPLPAKDNAQNGGKPIKDAKIGKDKKKGKKGGK
jgi:hypothetical protein